MYAETEGLELGRFWKWLAARSEKVVVRPVLGIFAVLGFVAGLTGTIEWDLVYSAATAIGAGCIGLVTAAAAMGSLYDALDSRLADGFDRRDEELTARVTAGLVR